jgi:aspartyl-tRNA(Asn)/glutamyl-tRNA(Gln) amidotransferase subunit B
MLAEESRVNSIHENMPEPAHIKSERFVKQYGIPEEHAMVLTSEIDLADAFEEVARQTDPNLAASWMRDEVKRVIYYNKQTFKESGITPTQLVDLFQMIDEGKITTKAGQRIIEKLPHTTKMPSQIAEEMGLIGVVEEDQIYSAVCDVIGNNPEAVQDYYSGNQKALNFLVGQVMRITRGKADPAHTNQLLRKELEKKIN